MPRHRRQRGRTRRADPARRDLADLLGLLEALTTRPTSRHALMARLGIRGVALAAAIEKARQQGIHIVTADRLTARLASPADSDRALDLVAKIAPGRVD